MYFRNQGFTTTQAWYLTQPYTGVGHHFPFTQRIACRWGLPDWLLNSPYNVLKPGKISRERFYELHYMVDPDFHGAAFPRYNRRVLARQTTWSEEIQHMDPLVVCHTYSN